MKNSGNQKRLSAILFADIQGYSALMQANEANALDFLNHYQNSLSTEVTNHDGEIIKNYGDGSLCLFSSVASAVLCAKDLQFRLQKQEPYVPLRIGLHVGDVFHMDNDVYGDAINIASRIESMGVPGNVLLSRSVYAKVKNQTELQMESLGTFEFKNIEEPLEVYALANEGLVVPKRSELKGKLKESTEGFLQSKAVLFSTCIIALASIIGIWFWQGQKGAINKDAQVVGKLDDADYSNEKSIAVLAFADMSPEQDQNYFSDGISEEILNMLTKIPKLKVISRTSSFAFKDKESTTSEIGETLKVNHLLDGSVRKSGNAFRIATQLIESKTGTQIWSETFDRPMDDIFKIQDEIAHKVIEQLKVSLMGKSITSKTVNVEAYNMYLEAKLIRDNRSAESDSLAETIIRESIGLDSTYAPAWAVLSELIFNGAFSYSRYSIEESIAKSLAAAHKAIELDPSHSAGYIALTTVNRAENNFKSADKNLKKALEIDPENVDVIYESASYDLDLGNMESAIEKLRKAIRLDPVNYLLQYTLGLHLLWVEDYEGAEKAMEKYIRMNPSSGIANNFMAQIYLEQDKIEEAKAALAIDTDPYWSIYRKSILSFVLGDQKNADKHLATFIEQFGAEGWPNIAHVYACRGEKEEAFKWLELALENKDASLMEILNYPEFKIMHDDERWNAFIEKLNLPSNEGFSKR